MLKRLTILLISLVTYSTVAQVSYPKNKHNLTNVIKRFDLICANSFFGDTVLYLLTIKRYPDLDTIRGTNEQRKQAIRKWQQSIKLWNKNVLPFEPKKIIHFTSEGNVTYLEINACKVGEHIYTVDTVEIDDYKFFFRFKRRWWNEDIDKEVLLDYIYDLIACEKNMYTFKLRWNK